MPWLITHVSRNCHLSSPSATGCLQNSLPKEPMLYRFPFQDIYAESMQIGGCYRPQITPSANVFDWLTAGINFSIRIPNSNLSARAAAVAAAAAAASRCLGALLLDCCCYWRGLEELCSGVELHKRGSHTGNVHPQGNVHSKHNTRAHTRTHTHTHTHFTTACLYHQSVIKCAHTNAHTCMSQQLCIIRVQWGLLRGTVSPYTGGCMQHQPTLATSIELSPGGRPTGFFCLTGCPFLAAWAMASLF
eukprot:1156048-Pelagomonas_calceolata.AAC.8